MRLGVETDVTALRERFAAWPRQAEARRNSSPNPEAGLQEPARHEAGNAPHMAVRDEAEPEAEICRGRPPQCGRGRRDRVTELAEPTGRLAGDRPCGAGH